MSETKPTKWKEILMREVQENILGRLGEIESQDDLVRVTKEEVTKSEKEFSLTLNLIRDTLQELPVEVLKQQR